MEELLQSKLKQLIDAVEKFICEFNTAYSYPYDSVIIIKTKEAIFQAK
ncbi:hypothetical protein [Thermovibrio sp.]